MIPRNHTLQAALDAAERGGTLDPVRRLLKVLARPFDEPADDAGLGDAPPESTPQFVTYCGT